MAKGTVVKEVVIPIATANFGRGVSQKVFNNHVDRLLDAMKDDDFILGCQEIDEADKPEESKYLSRRGESMGYGFAGRATAVPILFRKIGYRPLRRKVNFASPGLARFTPHRVVVEAVLELWFKAWLPKIVVLNTHLPIDRPATKRLRAMVRARLSARATRHALMGRIVIWIADTNTRGRFPKMMPRDRKILDAGIDEIHISVPKRYRVEVIRKEKVDFNIDGHDGWLIWVRITLKPRKKQ